MKKLKLDLDALEIDTFEPAPLDDAEGTVRGEQFPFTGMRTCVSCVVACVPTYMTCSCYGTCDFSCGGTCWYTCRLTCRYDICRLF